MSAVAAGATKKRKKSDTKPQAQINKCNNEKRRREQENIYIEELAELISANFGDMSSLSVKPDKCAILQETVNQIRNIKAREEAAAAGGGGGSTPGQPDAVQQGEVSSSRPTILANEVIAPLLLEALDGFLFVVSAEGKVEFVTDNVISYIKFSREEVLGKSVYNIIHHGDHARFSTTLLPSISWGSGASGSGQSNDSNPSQNTAANNNSGRSRSFYCRLLIKPPDDQDETMEERQTRSNHYEQMHISSTQLPYNHASGGGMGGVSDVEDGGSGDPGPCLMCLARRVPQCEKATGSSIEQFTTKLDTAGKIIGIDTSGVSATYSAYLNKDLMGRVIQELCMQQELHKFTTHMKDTLSTGQATSEIYRLRISSQDKYIRVQTKSKLFKYNPPDEDFIMATHSIIGDHEPNLELDSGNVGGPLMPSVMNGTRNGVPSSRFSGSVSAASDGGSSATSSNNSLTPTSSASYQFTLNTDLEFDFFPTSTWGELGGTAWSEGPPRPDSCASVTPVSTPTPRPPSAPVYSPAPPALPSPAAASQAAPQPFTAAFPFSPLQDSPFPADEPSKDSKENVLEEASAMAESGRLRNLLTKPPASASDAANDAEHRGKNRILKDLLNQVDDEENRSENRTSPRGLVGGRSNVSGSSSGPGPSPGQASGSTDQPKHANNMLLRLLNEKSDDDDLEQRAGLKKQSELLQQLLKEQDEERKAPEPAAAAQAQDDALLRSLGFTSSPSPPAADLGPGKARKRPSDERDDLIAKRPNDSVQVSSSGPSVGNSKLYEKNKMLAQLLAKQPSCTPIPPIPPSVISATPQDKLPRVTKNEFGMPVTSQAGSVVDSRSGAGRGRMPNRPPPTSYLNQMLTPGGGNDSHSMQNQHLRQAQAIRGQFTQMDTNTYPTSATMSSENTWDMQSSDPLLSDILDSVIDIVPDAVISDSSAIMNLLDAIESPQNNNNFHQAMNEKMAINAIQKSLMQCETAVKSPSSPTISLPSTPPAYSQAMTSVQTSQQQTTAGFPPPPVYQRPNPSGGFQLQQQRPGVQSVRPGAGGQYVMAPGQQQQLLIQQRKLLQQQQEHKRRLLQQQQQQQLLIPSNAAAAELNTGLQNIDNLINNTVAPNVTLQRSSSVPDSQLSPGYNNSIMNVNNNNQQQRQPYSPHSQMASPLSQQQASGYPAAPVSVNNFQQGGARLSPHPPFQQQLSPRQSYPPGQQPSQPTTWAQTQVANRLSLQQQQNPMLNAQLTGTYNNTNRGFQVQRQQASQQQRAIGSPGAAATRQSPFPAETFPPPASPTSGFNQSQFQQQMRLQRTISAPSATTQLPGGLGSPRPYVGRGDHPPGLHSPYPAPHPPPPPHPHQHQHPMMYQQDSQYCYDQAGLQLAYNGADRGRGPPPHLQGGGAGGGNGMNATSEYVRQELRAVVGARTGQAPPPNVRQSQQQVSPSDLEALGLSFDMPTSGASDSPKLWGAMGSDMGSMSPQPPPTLSSSSRTTTEEMGRPGDQKSSLLQKLLSE